MSIIKESQMASSSMKRLNIPVTQFMKSWTGEIGMSKSWAKYPGLVFNGFTKIDKRKMRINDNN